jgi:hypothetical protein
MIDDYGAESGSSDNKRRKRVKRMPYYGECVERTARSPDGGDYNTS